MLEINRIRNFINEEAYGEYINAEYDRLYANDIFLNDKIDAITGKGFSNGKLFLNVNDLTKLFLRKWSNYEVSGSNLVLNLEQSLDFAALTNIFLPNNIQINSVSQIQNKHVLILITNTGILQAQVVDSIFLPAASHSYDNNISLLQDFYSTTPAVFDATKNGYYVNSKRVIATARISATSEVEFFYELGNGHRFKDVEHLATGQKFTETRWKHEHPACYVPDGSTITNMNLEAPELFRILGTNILPDWTDRFARNISPNSIRSLRDTQEDAFQGFSMTSSDAPNALNTSGGFAFGFTTAYGSGSNIMNIFNDSGFGVPRIADETRPKNYSVSTQIVRG